MNLFDSVRVRKPRRNKFDLSHEKKLTLNMGYLYPILCEEVLPGDSWRIRTQVFLRFLALLAPVMHRVDVTIHCFSVPVRLLWSNFEEFITGGRLGTAAPTIPYFNSGYLNNNDIAGRLHQNQLLDYLGFPVMKTGELFKPGYAGLNFSILPLRAYLLIYDQYYRNQNVEDTQLPINFKSDGEQQNNDLFALTFLRPRAWEKDYLTSCLPNTQRGDPVSVPITSSVTYRKPSVVRKAADDALFAAADLQTDAGGNVIGVAGQGTGYVDNIASITSSNLTINALRAAVRLQEWREKNELGGGRYTEQLRAHFGVVSSDARLQRVEYLGGSKQPVVISENLQTAPAAGGSTPLATLSGKGLSVGGNGYGITKYFEEHGFVMCIMSVMPRTSYQESTPKKWLRIVNTDYYFPEFAHLGEQTVSRKEAYLNMADAGAVALDFDGTFGYQSRYAEYKYIPSSVHGEFRSNLGYWTLVREFATVGAPSLSPTFVYGGVSVKDDIFAVQTDVHHIVAQVYFNISAIRPMPYFATPSL